MLSACGSRGPCEVPEMPEAPKRSLVGGSFEVARDELKGTAAWKPAAEIELEEDLHGGHTIGAITVPGEDTTTDMVVEIETALSSTQQAVIASGTAGQALIAAEAAPPPRRHCLPRRCRTSGLTVLCFTVLLFLPFVVLLVAAALGGLLGAVEGWGCGLTVSIM